jgi:membrane-associated phospholipid phosphatase
MRSGPEIQPLADQQDELREGGRWILGIAVGVAALAVSYVLAVWTRSGQALENAALRGADQVRDEDLANANDSLHAITIGSLVASLVLVGVIALVRRRWDLAVAGVGVIVLGQVLAQGLKRLVLPRPELVDVVGDYTNNSFPSGHTTIAMTVMFALVLVVPYRLRGIMMFFVVPWALAVGGYTITAKWHRFSDTVGAMAIALICGCLASWWLSRRGGVIPFPGRTFPGRVVLVVATSVASVVSLVLGGFIWAVGFSREVDFSEPDEAWDYNAYLGASSLSVGCAGLTALVFWGLWHRREIASTSRRDP